MFSRCSREHYSQSSSRERQSAVRTSQRPFVGAGSTQAAKEPIDHLNGAKNHLQSARGHQSAKQSSVELHDVLGLCACPPPRVVGQVILLEVFKRRCPNQNSFAEGPILQPEHCHNEAVKCTSHTHCSECN